MIAVRCPECRRTSRVPDDAVDAKGNVCCPRCAADFALEVYAPEEGEEPPPKVRRWLAWSFVAGVAAGSVLALALAVAVAATIHFVKHSDPSVLPDQLPAPAAPAAGPQAAADKPMAPEPPGEPAAPPKAPPFEATPSRFQRCHELWDAYRDNEAFADSRLLNRLVEFTIVGPVVKEADGSYTVASNPEGTIVRVYCEVDRRIVPNWRLSAAKSLGKRPSSFAASAPVARACPSARAGTVTLSR